MNIKNTNQLLNTPNTRNFQQKPTLWGQSRSNSPGFFFPLGFPNFELQRLPPRWKIHGWNPQNNGRFGRWFSFSTGWSLGSMLIFRGVKGREHAKICHGFNYWNDDVEIWEMLIEHVSWTIRKNIYNKHNGILYNHWKMSDSSKKNGMASNEQKPKKKNDKAQWGAKKVYCHTVAREF